MRKIVNLFIAVLAITAILKSLLVYPVNKNNITQASNIFQLYTVEAGDTYWKIACKLKPYWKCHVKEIEYELRELNNIPPDKLQIGYKLKIPYKDVFIDFLEDEEALQYANR